MTFKFPLLLLKRLIVLHRGVSVYDQKFHDGVNIIRGENSSGKSTILDFIFFALGGDFSAWKPEAESCQAVLAEVEINETVLTLRRGVSEGKSQPMEIFWGSLEDATSSPVEGWEVHPFRRTENKENFSQVLFRALKLPEVRGELTSNITMNQLLRCICVDQLSSVNSILRDEPWDSPTTRKAIGDLLYGIYDDQLYADELELRDVEKKLEKAQSEHDSLLGALSGAGQQFDLSAIEGQINETNDRIALLRVEIQNAQGGYEVPGAPEDSSELQSLGRELQEAKSRFACASEKKRTLEMEVEDSEAFIENLQKRLNALDESLATEEALGRLALQLCPECLQPLTVEHTEGHCFLCKQPAPEEGYKKHIARLRNELATQIHESSGLLDKKRSQASEQSKEADSAWSSLLPLERRFSDLLSRSRSRRDAYLDDLLEKKGTLEGSLAFLDKQKKLAECVKEAFSRINVFQMKVANLKSRIKNARGLQDAHRIDAENCINRYATEFLKRDLAREDLFATPKDVRIDFERNISLVDERSSFSASSISYLKASVHFSILFASLELDFLRYPKLIVNDNIEDKGMEKERSQNLQRLVVEFSRKASVRHQIIIATSMIDPSLETEEFCIGPAYTKQSKTLRLPRFSAAGEVIVGEISLGEVAPGNIPPRGIPPAGMTPGEVTT